ncbi:HlyD family secretion protein [Alkalispirillum mobile]|uniref:HlyD family secretion protein n=1 Tax=Alkalispirillum mobile TaxID=85925 RepID=A0A498C4K0_9GAMM|nr:efflux RND transporter periplasmic adaptor subunit [Alkalispirillum mobile]RLK50502.1 HlyD family secretion protein [Alkalispirillum mobile]
MNWKRIATWSGVLLVAVVLLFLGFRPQPVWVDTSEVDEGTVRLTVEEEGKTRVMYRYVLSAPVTAHARRVEPEVGDPVAPDDVLVRLDPLVPPALDLRSERQARARVEGAESALETAREELTAARAAADFADETYQRLSRLGERGAVSAHEVDGAAAQARQTAAAVAAARYRVNTARADLEDARLALAFAGERDAAAPDVIELTAPVSGEVLARHFESARVVQPGEPILEVADTRALEVEVEVLSADAVRIRPGMPVSLQRWGGEPALAGVVRRVEPRGFTKFSALGVEEQRVLVIVDFVTAPEQWAALGDGYRVNAEFELDRREGVTRVPVSALFRDGEDWAVFVVDAGRARVRAVERGLRGGGVVEVRSGLEPGEQVIVHPDRELSEGHRVRVRPAP